MIGAVDHAVTGAASPYPETVVSTPWTGSEVSIPVEKKVMVHSGATPAWDPLPLVNETHAS